MQKCFHVADVHYHNAVYTILHTYRLVQWTFGSNKIDKRDDDESNIYNQQGKIKFKHNNLIYPNDAKILAVQSSI